MRYRAVAFDFDYTLADSSAGVIACVGYALAEMGLPPAGADDIRRTIGLSLPETFARLTGSDEAGRAGEFVRLFVERADRVMVDLTTIYPGAAGLVGALRGRGLRVGIVSTKYRYRIEWTLDRAGLLPLFDVIVGGEDVANHKPDPEGLLVAVARLGATPETTLYVGDSAADARAAALAGVPFVWVRTGTTEPDDLCDLPILATAYDLDDLARRLDDTVLG